MRIVIASCLLLLMGKLTAQSESSSTEGQSATGTQEFCTPGVANKSRSRGVELYYTVAGGGPIERRRTENQEEVANLSSYQRFGIKLNVPLVLKPNFKLLLGYSYQPERYQYNNLSPEIQPYYSDLNNNLLKNNSLNLLLTKSLSSTKYLVIYTRIAFNGDYDGWINFDQRYHTYNAFSILGFKKREDFEWGVGLYYTQNMRRRLLLPFAMMNKNFNDKWGVELAPPAYVLARYNINPKSILLFGGEFNSLMYSISSRGVNTLQQAAPPEYSMNHNDISAVVSVERELVNWLWLNIKGGYRYNIGSRFESSVDGYDSFRLRLPSAPFLQVGLFLSPPDHLK